MAEPRVLPAAAAGPAESRLGGVAQGFACSAGRIATKGHDFVEDRTREGRRFRALNVVDEFSRECLAIWIARRPDSTGLIGLLTDLLINRGIPAYIRSDSELRFVASAVKAWITELGAKPAYIEPGTFR